MRVGIYVSKEVPTFGKVGNPNLAHVRQLNLISPSSRLSSRVFSGGRRRRGAACLRVETCIYRMYFIRLYGFNHILPFFRSAPWLKRTRTVAATANLVTITQLLPLRIADL